MIYYSGTQISTPTSLGKAHPLPTHPLWLSVILSCASYLLLLSPFPLPPSPLSIVWQSGGASSHVRSAHLRAPQRVRCMSVLQCLEVSCSVSCSVVHCVAVSCSVLPRVCVIQDEEGQMCACACKCVCARERWKGRVGVLQRASAIGRAREQGVCMTLYVSKYVSMLPNSWGTWRLYIYIYTYIYI